MIEANRLLLAVWREACRHVRIEESVAAIGRLVLERIPVEAMVVRRFDQELATIETVGSFDRQAPHATLEAGRQGVPPGKRKAIRAWLEKGAMLEDSDNVHRELRLLVPHRAGGDPLVAPLVSEHGTHGLLVYYRKSGEQLREAEESMARQLLEPLSAALENDHRLHELTSLRAAAEADRQALLRRMGRERLDDEIIGADAGLKPVMDRIELVSRSSAPVLILGETGSGKEVIARAIHNKSKRCGNAFIRVNCGAIPPDLIDSELFGHEKGAFTGATSTRRGWFERADEGTLLLDEIGELPLAAQVRLLRILQDGTFERVGGEEPIKVDVRMIAATHRDLPLMVQQSRFREDLWYRIAVFPIVLPPLREHNQDIPSLAAHFIHRASTRFGLTEVLPNEGDLELLRTYDWPGNVREFAAVIDRAVILGEGERLEIAKALGGSAALTAARPPGRDTPSPTHIAAVADGDLLTLDGAIRNHVEKALCAARGRIEGPRGAARLLDVNPHTLRARMRKLGIDWARFRVEGVL